MKRVKPDEKYRGIPCITVAVGCAGGETRIPAGLKADGYCTLKEANKYIRRYLPVKKRMGYKRGSRPLLKDLGLQGRAIVCVLGHFLYLDGERYWSFFNNSDDEVVAVWELGSRGGGRKIR